MSDVQWLFLVLAVLYGWECACWVRRGSVVFTTWLGRNWQAQHPGTLLGNQRGGFIFAAPLPPLGTLLTASPLPISLSTEGVLGYVSTNVNPGWRPAQTDTFFRFEDIREIKPRGKKLFVNGEIMLMAATVGQASYFADQLRQFVKLPLSQRETAITAFVHSSLDATLVEQRWLEFRKLARPLRLLGNVLFVYLFVLAPVWIWQLGFRLSWLGLVIGLFALTTIAAVFFFRAHQKLYPKADDERFTHTLTIMLAPMTTIRAHDTLSRPLFDTFHPLAVAELILSNDKFRDLARRILLDLRHPAEPVCTNADASARAMESNARAITRQAAEQFLKQSGLEPDELCKPPTPADESCRAYCPRCRAQFTTPTGNCADCGGLALVSF